LRLVRGLFGGIFRREKRPSPLARPDIEQLVGFRVRDLSLYERAMRHRSLLRGEANTALRSNERLEFLGDAVLGFITAEHLHQIFPTKDEGFLTRLRAKLVNGKALAECAEQIDLGRLILMSKNMAQEQGRQNRTILADAYEALIGALYLDLGLAAARTFVHRTVFAQVDLVELAQQHDNYKSLLLEFAQARGWSQPTYRVVSEEGPSHARMFTVEAVLQGSACGLGQAGSKKLAEQRAAREALRSFRERLA
jgi:ribonuclease-3